MVILIRNFFNSFLVSVFDAEAAAVLMGASKRRDRIVTTFYPGKPV